MSQGPRREAEQIIARWRDAGRRADATSPGTAAHVAALADFEDARLAYHDFLTRLASADVAGHVAELRHALEDE